MPPFQPFQSGNLTFNTNLLVWLDLFFSVDGFLSLCFCLTFLTSYISQHHYPQSEITSIWKHHITQQVLDIDDLGTCNLSSWLSSLSSQFNTHPSGCGRLQPRWGSVRPSVRMLSGCWTGQVCPTPFIDHVWVVCGGQSPPSCLVNTWHAAVWYKERLKIIN